MNLSDKKFLPYVDNYEDYLNDVNIEKYIYGSHDGKVTSEWIEGYIKEALSHDGVYIGTHKNSNIVSLFTELKDKNGENILIFQSVSFDPRDSTFFFIEKDGEIKEYNRNKQCYGLNIWEFDALLNAIYVCGKCGVKINSRDEWYHIPDAQLYCSSCKEEIEHQDTYDILYGNI